MLGSRVYGRGKEFGANADLVEQGTDDAKADWNRSVLWGWWA